MPNLLSWMLKNLLPCPFCGSPAEYDSQRHVVRSSPRSPKFHDVLGHAVYCSSMECECSVGIHETAQKAIRAWNLRVSS